MWLSAKSNQNFMDLEPAPLPVQTNPPRQIAQDVMNSTEFSYFSFYAFLCVHFFVFLGLVMSSFFFASAESHLTAREGAWAWRHRNEPGHMGLSAKSNQNFMDLEPAPFPVQTTSNRQIAQDVMNSTEIS